MGNIDIQIAGVFDKNIGTERFAAISECSTQFFYSGNLTNQNCLLFSFLKKKADNKTVINVTVSILKEQKKMLDLYHITSSETMGERNCSSNIFAFCDCRRTEHGI